MNNLKIKVRNSLLFPPEIKQKLLSIPNWSSDIKETVKEVFSKYSSFEEIVLNDISDIQTKIYLKSLQDTENLNRREDFNILEELEKNFI